MNVAADNIETLLQDASAAWNAGNQTAAEHACRQVLRQDPANSAALTLIGFIELSQGRYSEALPVYDQLCRLEAGEASHWMNYGSALRGTNSPDEALTAFAKAAELGIAKSADFYFNLGLTHLARGDFEAARAVLTDALELAPDDVEIRYRYVLACYECMRFEMVHKAMQDWPPPAGAALDTIAAIAHILMNVGDYARAEEILDRWLRGTTNSEALLILTQIRERTNRLAEARKLIDELSSRPDASIHGAELHRVAAKIAQRESNHELAVQLYRRALLDYRDEHEKHFILFPLATSLHALGRIQETIGALIEAHRSQVAYIRRSRPLAGLRGTPQMQITEFSCDPADVAKWDYTGAPSLEASPIFVVAFPRSGTTLLELTLDAHPALRSMDEQPFIQNAVEDMLALGMKYPEELSPFSPQQLEDLRAKYWERTRKKVQLEPRQRLVDKNPLNILRLPAIVRLFPNAPIVLAIRHPYDVILSCYMQHFRAPDFAMLCSEMPSLTIGYRKTFDFWYENVEMLKPHVLEVHYERLVSNFGPEVRRIADFLRLPWNPVLLKPGDRAQAKGYISTPSYSQVVQPVNTKAVGRWQAYRNYLQPAYPVVEPYINRWGYES